MRSLISQISTLFYWSVSVFVPVPCCLGYGSLIIQIEGRWHDTSSFVLLLRIVLAIRVVFWFHIDFKVVFFSSSVNNVNGSLMGMALNLHITLGSMAIFMI